MRYFLIGEDKSLKDVTDVVLALTGGAMTGNIRYDSGSRNGAVIRFVEGDSYGSCVGIGDGGTTIVGGGESVTQLLPASGSGGAEKLILANDGEIDFYTNCQNGADSATHVTLSKAGLLSGHQKAIKYGTAAPSGGSNGDIYIQY